VQVCPKNKSDIYTPYAALVDNNVTI
jgi:hypothetical protein